MKEILKQAEKLRNSSLHHDVYYCDNDNSFFSPDKCYFKDDSLFFALMYCNILVKKDENQIFILDAETSSSLLIPFECEDEKEFFQLSTVYDFKDIKFEDLKQFRDLFYFMKEKYKHDKGNI